MTSAGPSDLVLVLDACILVSGTLRQVFLRAASQGLCRLHWSARVLDETTRTLVRLGHLDDEGAAFLRTAITQVFPEALVAVSAALLADMRNQASDRHVVAAAVVSGASTIVTVNLRDFPPPALRPWGIQALHPDRVLQALWATCPGSMLAVLQELAADAPAGYDPWEATLYALRRVAPRFARQVQAGGT